MADHSSTLTCAEKFALITPWINPEERITVQFDDQGDINTVVTDCTKQLVDVELETPVPHMRQKLSVPLREPDRPLHFKRLLLVITVRRPAIAY